MTGICQPLRSKFRSAIAQKTSFYKSCIVGKLRMIANFFRSCARNIDLSPLAGRHLLDFK